VVKLYGEKGSEEGEEQVTDHRHDGYTVRVRVQHDQPGGMGRTQENGTRGKVTVA
jgi:hypothetical protein